MSFESAFCDKISRDEDSSRKSLMEVAKEISKDAKVIFDEEDETYDVFKDHVRKTLKFDVDEVQLRALFKSLDANRDGHIGSTEVAAFVNDENKEDDAKTDKNVLKMISEIRVKQAVELANQELALQEERSENVIERMKEQCIESLKKASSRVNELKLENKMLKEKITRLEEKLKTQTKMLSRESMKEKADVMKRILTLERENSELLKSASERGKDPTMAKAWARIQSLEVENSELRSSLIAARTENDDDYDDEVKKDESDDVQRLTRRILTMSLNFEKEQQSQQDRYERLAEVHEHLKSQFGQTLDETTRTLESVNMECRRLRVVEKAFHVYVHDEREKKKLLLQNQDYDDEEVLSNKTMIMKSNKNMIHDDVTKSLFRIFCKYTTSGTNSNQTRCISVSTFTRLAARDNKDEEDLVKCIFREASLGIKSRDGDFVHFLRSLVGLWKQFDRLNNNSFAEYVSMYILRDEMKGLEDNNIFNGIAKNVEGTNLQRRFQRCTTHFLEHYASRRNSCRGPMLTLPQWLKFASDLQLTFILDKDVLIRVFCAHACYFTKPSDQEIFWNQLEKQESKDLQIEFGISDPDTFWNVLLSCAYCLNIDNNKLHVRVRAMFLWMWRLFDAEASLDSQLVRASRSIERIQNSIINLSAIRKLRLASAHFCFAFIHDWRCHDLREYGLVRFLKER